MTNNGLFNSLFIESLKTGVALDDAARSRMTTLAQAWRGRDASDAGTLWDSFMKQAVSYLEFVPPPAAEGAYPLYEDWGFSNSVTVLYLIQPGADLDDASVGRFYPAKLLARLRERQLDWGILTDGARWRLYSTQSARPYEDYVELPLAEVLESDDEREYGLFERFFHKDSFVAVDSPRPLAGEGLGVRGLNRDRAQSEAVLREKVKEPLLYQIDEVLQYFCNGFIHDTRKTGEDYAEEERAAIFASAVKLLYRCLFLFYAEAHHLLPSDAGKAETYRQHSLQALCREARRFHWGQRTDTDLYDLWNHLKGLVGAVNEGDPEYGVMGYDGGLFDDTEEAFLGQHRLRNDFLSRALYLLAYVEPAGGEPDDEYPIPYQDLEVRHLGEIYENILEYQVRLADADRYRRHGRKGGIEYPLASQTPRQSGDTVIRKGEVYFGESALERKQTGSYYTPESLVRFLNEKTIVQPLRDRFEQDYRPRFAEFLERARQGADAGERQGAARAAAALVERFAQETVLRFKVCDPAMGSGHFLVDAANRMAGLVVALLAEIPPLTPDPYSPRPLAGEGSGVRVEGAPRDASHPNVWRRLVTRHCLYGVDLNPLAVTLAKLSLWLNCFAREHRLTFLDHHLRQGNSLIGLRSLGQLRSIPKRRKDSRRNPSQGLLFNFNDLSETLAGVGSKVASIAALPEDDTESQKAVLEESFETTARRLRPLADLFTGYLMSGEVTADHYEAIFKCLAEEKPVESVFDAAVPAVWGRIQSCAARHRFFHWPLEFPDVFGPGAVGGFSGTIGNPPWDIVKPNSQEFFSFYDSGFRSYGKQEASRVSSKLMRDNPAIRKKWEEYNDAFTQQSAYFKEPVSYSALGNGDINTFKIFLEQFFSVLRKGGRMGIVVPSGIYTDQGCQPLRELFFNKSRIEFLYGFENRWPTVFSAVDGRFKFVIFGAEKGGETIEFKCAFMEHDPERLPAIHTNALKMKVADVKKFSPDSLSVMEFRSQQDIDITSKIYGDWPLLGEQIQDTWNVKFRSELHMTNDSHLFKNTPTEYPLYEGKMIWHFDSKFEEPRFWLKKEEVEENLGLDSRAGRNYRVGFRDVAASTNERTLISSIIPKCWHGNTIPTVSPYDNEYFQSGLNKEENLWLTSLLSSFCCDFVIRQKITNHMNFFYMNTLPIARAKESYLAEYSQPVIARAARLICTDKQFADLWQSVFSPAWNEADFWYPVSGSMDYGPAHEQDIRQKLAESATTLTQEWGPHCGVHNRLPDRRDTGDRAQLRAEIDAYVAHLYGLSREDFAYILDTFPVLKRKEEAAFGEFRSRRKCLEEYDRLLPILKGDGSNHRTHPGIR